MKESFWYLLGFIGQGMFFLRFFFQWLASEKRGKSIIPIQFWHLSLLGSFLVLIYALYRKDPVFILGQSLGIFIYARNLYLIYKERNSLL